LVRDERDALVVLPVRRLPLLAVGKRRGGLEGVVQQKIGVLQQLLAAHAADVIFGHAAHPCAWLVGPLHYQAGAGCCRGWGDNMRLYHRRRPGSLPSPRRDCLSRCSWLCQLAPPPTEGRGAGFRTVLSLLPCVGEGVRRAVRGGSVWG